MTDYVKCDCGAYNYEEDMEECKWSGQRVCPSCSKNCPRCEAVVHEDATSCLICRKNFQ